MKQKQIFTVAAATDAVELILGGITQVGAGVSLPHNATADINTDLVNQIMACGNHEQAKQIKATLRNALLAVLKEVQGQIRATRDVSKLNWGNEYSELFTALGFQGSLQVPEGIEELKRMLQAIIAHLTANPTQEVGTLVTAARAQTLLTALLAAQNAIVAQDVTISTLMNVRDEKFETLRKRISGVYQELRLQLDPLDERWGNFGFYKPGADETPDQVTGLKVTLIGPTAAATKWEASVRASYYRVYIRVIGVDADYRAIGSPADLDFTIENLPANASIDVVVTAVNNGGEGARSEVMHIATH
ncbi:MAG: hypothetical protein JWM68_397 [Verrucomicrobiales bacterium]|nr:hypothetical protein [Verrucomicrobiales bacterium]